MLLFRLPERQNPALKNGASGLKLLLRQALLTKFAWLIMGCCTICSNTTAATPRGESHNQEVLQAQIDFKPTSRKPRGILVLAGVYPAKSPEPIAQEKAWLDFAALNDLVLCKANFELDTKLAVSEAAYLAACNNAGQILMQCLQSNKIAGLPLYLFGIGSGASFVASFVDLHPRSVAAWSALGITRSIDLPLAKLPPGVVAAGDLDINYESDRRLARSMRKQGFPIAWISVPQQRAGRAAKVEDFTRAYFNALLNPASGAKPVFVDNLTKQTVASSDLKRLIGASFLPSQYLLPDWAALHKESSLIFLTVPTGLEEYPELTMAVRLPPKDPGNRPLRVVAYSPWTENPDAALATIRNDNFSWNKFAAERNMAVVTWNAGVLFKAFFNADQLDAWQARKQGEVFAAVGRAWLKAFKTLAQENNLRQDGILLYGLSAGGNFCGRLAMAVPGAFSVVIVHVGNSFDKPTLTASNIVWLLSSGENDPGLNNVMRFYRECRDLHLPVFMKRFRALAHAENAESLAFAGRFFDYYLAHEQSQKKLPTILAADLEKPPYLADIVNNLVFPISKANAAPLDQCIPLPDEDSARMWGRMIVH